MAVRRPEMRHALLPTLALISVLVCAPASPAVVYLNHFNDSIAADYSAADPTAKSRGGAKITAGGRGYAFRGEAKHEALDLSFADPALPAGVDFEVPVSDLRSGTIELFIKTGFHWGMKKGRPGDPKDMGASHYFLRIPTKGGVWHSINVMWYNRFVPMFALHIYEGTRDYLANLRGDSGRIPVDLKPGVWHYVAATWTPGRMRLFIDGQLAQELKPDRPLNIPLPDGLMTLGAGEHRGIKLEPANALVDELRICNRALYQGKGEIGIPERPLTLEEEPQAKKSLAVGGPGTVLYRSPRKTYPAPRLSRAPTVDGSLDEPTWRTAPRVGGLTTIDLEQQCVPAQTLIRAGWDGRNLYIGVECFEDPELMAKLVAEKTGQDAAVFADDSIELFLGPKPGEPGEYYQLCVNTAGGFYDGKRLSAACNGVWQQAARVAGDRYTVEIAIPFTTLDVEPPTHGTQWTWNVCRNRKVRDEGAASSWAELIGGYHRPDDFNRMLFQDARVDVQRAERELNRDFLASVREQAQAVVEAAGRELASARRVLRHVEEGEPARNARLAVEARVSRLRTFLGDDTADLEDAAQVLLGLEATRLAVRRLTDAVDRLGVSLVGELPRDMEEGVTQRGGYWFLRSPEMIAAVSAATGAVTGIWDGARTPIVRYSYEQYLAETPTTETSSDERQDEVVDARRDDEALVLTCQNPLLPGIQLIKTYRLAEIGGRRRLLDKTFTVKGATKQKTLVRLTSKTAFDAEFLKDTYYHRIMTAGTMGDPRSVVPAATVTEPIKVRFVFRSEEGWANFGAVNTGRDAGIGQYFFTVDGRWVPPKGTTMSYFDEGGWRVGWFAAFAKPTGRSATIRYHLFEGDRIDYHREVAALPERQAIVDAVPVSDLARRIRYLFCARPGIGDPKTQSGSVAGFLSDRLRSGEHTAHYGMAFRDLRYGDYPAGDAAVLEYEYGPSSRTVTAKYVRQLLQTGKRLFPRVHSGWYKSPQNISKLSKTFKEHPEWVLKDQHGKIVDAYWSGEFVNANWCPAFCDHLIERFCTEMDYYGTEIIYLDWDLTQFVVDWENHAVRYSPYQADWLARLYRAVQKRDGILWINAVTSTGLYDFGYWEGWGHYDRRWKHWRNGSEHLMMRRLYERPQARDIVLYWKGGDQFREQRNYRDYTNLTLSLCLFPTGCWHDPYHIHFKDPKTGKTDWCANRAHQMAYFDVGFELAENEWADVDLKPAWWRDLDTEVESYAFRKGDAYILTALRHDSQAADHTLSVSLDKMGFSRGRDVYAYQYWPRDPDDFPRRGGEQPKDWDRMFTKRTCTVIPAADLKHRLRIGIPALKPKLVRMISLTQVPAVFCSQEGKKTNLLLPTMLRGAIHRLATESVRAQTPLPAEILVHAPADGTVVMDGQQVEAREVWLGRTRFLRVGVVAGQSSVRLSSR